MAGGARRRGARRGPAGAISRLRVVAQSGHPDGTAAGGRGDGTPPPAPPELYKPERQLEEATGKASYEQAEQAAQRAKTDAENSYGVTVTEDKAKTNELLAALANSSAKLGRRQNEGANATGTLYGGALIQAAAQRANNEGEGVATDNANLNRELGAATLKEQQENNADAEAQLNAQSNEHTYTTGIESLEGKEAALSGYNAPKAPGLSGTTHGQWLQEPGGAVRVGGADTIKQATKKKREVDGARRYSAGSAVVGDAGGAQRAAEVSAPARRRERTEAGGRRTLQGIGAGRQVGGHARLAGGREGRPGDLLDLQQRGGRRGQEQRTDGPDPRCAVGLEPVQGGCGEQQDAASSRLAERQAHA